MSNESCIEIQPLLRYCTCKTRTFSPSLLAVYLACYDQQWAHTHTHTCWAPALAHSGECKDRIGSVTHPLFLKSWTKSSMATSSSQSPGEKPSTAHTAALQMTVKYCGKSRSLTLQHRIKTVLCQIQTEERRSDCTQCVCVVKQDELWIRQA